MPIQKKNVFMAKKKTDRKYKVQYRGGFKEIMIEDKLPTFSSMFNMQVAKMNVGEEMFEMTAGIIIKRME
jgi:hypothetical protein